MKKSTHSKAGDFDLGEVTPGSVAVDLLGLEGADGGLGEGVVVGVAHGTDRWVDAGVDEPGGERD